MIPSNLKIMRWDKLDMLTINKKDSEGNRLPFSILYVKLDGGIVEENNVICTSVDHSKGFRRCKFLNTLDAQGNAETRTLDDVGILRIDDYRIIKS